MNSKKPLNVGIIHLPFFGLVGSDRLILNAATSFQQMGHYVKIYTTDYDSTQTFKDVSSMTVVNRRTYLPIDFYGLGSPIFYFLKAVILVLTSFISLLKCDIVFCDQLPNPILLLRGLSWLWRGQRPFFAYYCHFPDSASVHSGGRVRRIYRAILNGLEGLGMTAADVVYANSSFTKNAILSCYHGLETKVRVLYPGIMPSETLVAAKIQKDPICRFLNGLAILCSINRIIPFKRIERIIKLTHALKTDHQDTNFITVIAGGIGHARDDYFVSLQRLCSSYGLSYYLAEGSGALLEPHETLSHVDVLFLLNATADQKTFLLAHSKAMFYSSSNEHFGMGISEAMLSRNFAIAMASGGPLEIIQHMKSGYLIPDPDPDAEFSPPMDLLGLLARLFASGPGDKNVPKDIQKIMHRGHAIATKSLTIESFTATIMRDGLNFHTTKTIN